MNQFLIILTIFISLPFLLDVVVSLLDRSHKTKPIPDNVKDIYDEAQYKKWVFYSTEKNNKKLLSKSLSLIIQLSILLFGGYQVIETISTNLSDNIYVINLLIVVIYGIILYVLSIVFEYIDTFIVEEKHGFNKTSHARFIKDQIIELFITGILGGGLLVLLTFIDNKVENMFYMYLFSILIVVIVLFNILFVKWIMPLFYKMSPLEEGALKDKITALSKISGYELSQIVVIDASTRTTKLNAFFSGFGKTKKVMIFDTLLNELTEDEICAVIAHEIGHANYNHMFKDMAKTVVNLALYTFLFYLLATSNIIGNNLEITEYFGFVVIVFVLLLSPLGIVTKIITNIISRKHEYQADAIAVDYGFGNEMITALKKVGRSNLASLTPHPLFVFMKYNHPPISDRVEALENKIQTSKK